MTQQTSPLSILQSALQGHKNGQRFWRSLEELADTEEFRALLAQELPRQTFALNADRRTFLKLMGASLAMLGLAGCTQAPREEIVPYVEAPEEIVPGKPLFFATAMPLNGYARGLLVENHMGRPTKVEGNPDHPANLGATDVFAQGSIFGLYDPDRAEVVTENGQIRTWASLLETVAAHRQGLSVNGGAGFHLLTETVTSPTLAAQIARLLEAFPAARWHQYEPTGLDNVRAGTQLAFGRILKPVYDLSGAERILALDANFLSSLPGSLRYARQFSNKRRAATLSEGTAQNMNRLYAVESTPTLTGAKADHRIALRADQIDHVARAVANQLGLSVAAVDLDPDLAAWIEAAVEDLRAFPGASLVIAGEEQPPAVHALAYAINAALDNIGRTVYFIEPVEADPVIQSESLRELTEAMAAGDVNTLVILDANPVFTAPVDLNFAELLAQVDMTIHQSIYYDETSALCRWHVPASHYLESWSDARAFDGTTSIIQPLIEPLFQSHTSHDLLAALLGETTSSSYEIVRSYWQTRFTELDDAPTPDFERFWRRALHAGVIAGTAATPVDVSLTADWGATLADPLPLRPSSLELNFRADPSIGDGRFANNPWLQELPKPLSTLTWDNAALISPTTALALEVTTQDLVELTINERTIIAPIFVLPGHADESVTLYLGYGHSWQNEISGALGFNAYALRTSDTGYFDSGLTLRKTGERYPLATVQNHFALEGRDLVRAATLAEFREDPDFAHGEHAFEGEPPSLYPEYTYTGNAWGMVIDLNACIGCNACVIGCQVENNIPTVGKEGVLNGREMHWIKVDTYFEGDITAPRTYFQPRPCMHCEKAPCEPVCPVEATVHSSEGLNQMVYNRCVGTRYCSNNCPYKVRRFNFFEYVDDEPELLKMFRNPDVTVRSRGVMEKCTYCVQRINQARIEADIENRPIRDGEIRTACQEVCPTQAIVFGDINDESARVTQLKANPLNYGMLEELGTQPRTSYLAAVINLE